MTTFESTDEFEDASFVRASFRGARLRQCDISVVTIRGAELNGLDIDSHNLAFGTLIVNGVDVVPFVEAELDRLFPGRAQSRSRTADGLRGSWAAVQQAWATTIEATPPELMAAHVPDEWSPVQTLRHLVLATDAWLHGAILREEQPFHEIGLLFTGAAEFGVDTSPFRTDTPTLEEVLEVRAERQHSVTAYLEAVSPAQLEEERADPWGDTSWHPTVGSCLRTILEEEWAHLRYVRRDLALLA